MGTVTNTYLTAGGALLASAAGAEAIGLDSKVEGAIMMAVGVIVFVVGATFFCLHAFTSAPRSFRSVADAGSRLMKTTPAQH